MRHCLRSPEVWAEMTAVRAPVSVCVCVTVCVCVCVCVCLSIYKNIHIYCVCNVNVYSLRSCLEVERRRV